MDAVIRYRSLRSFERCYINRRPPLGVTDGEEDKKGPSRVRFLKITVATNVKVISEIARTQSGGSWLAGKMI